MSTVGRDDLADALADEGTSLERLRVLVAAELARSARELGLPRAGVPLPVSLLVADAGDALEVVVPIDPAVRLDAAAVDERSLQLGRMASMALTEATEADVAAGAAGGWLLLRATCAAPDVDLAVVALDELAPADRLRTRALVVPHATLGRREEPRAHHADTLGLVADDLIAPAVAAPHDDPDDAVRCARRIARRLDGMGKWGGYHTAFAHLSRGFAGNDRRLAEDVGEAMVRAGLLTEKPSVGQRHVSLNSRRVADVRALIDRGELPVDLSLPET